MTGLSSAMAQMQAAWKRGDQSVFVSMLDQLKATSPDTYRMMFTERNERWADWIRARMQTPGTVFVAVGAGHLAGKDSLLVRLAERGHALAARLLTPRTCFSKRVSLRARAPGHGHPWRRGGSLSNGA